MNRLHLLAVGLAPLLGATQTFAQGSLIGLYAVTLTALHHVFLTPLRSQLSGPAYRLASLVLLAALGSCMQLALAAWALPLAIELGHWPALCAVQCLLIDHLLGKSPGWRPLAMYLIGLFCASVLIGACRQGLGQWTGMQLANLAPGALMVLGLVLALYNRLKTGKARPSREGKP
ncbi:NADH:quinone oxidoreductase [Pseudomonas putida]|uniref:NADH:quinone oxidoreductase n=1 Tax=Pseudomonas putida TaxID=303 RepID=A0A4D6X5C1_PSEPU|nr:Rnf-Nqr domain containing protein [Pseudomonas putida]QCI11056.1 NADH:quinone oxidoreductase [Pseudomonas putida]